MILIFAEYIDTNATSIRFRNGDDIDNLAAPFLI